MDRDAQEIDFPYDDDEYDPLEIERMARLPGTKRPETALDRAAPPPVPVLALTEPVRRRVRQINFRVSRAEYDDIHTVAWQYGVSPSRIARMLTLRGVRRAAQDA